MATTQKKVFTEDLQLGMFVCNLDRPWCETPFPIQGFYLEHNDDIKKLSGLCNHVYIDIMRARNIGGYEIEKKPAIRPSNFKAKEVIVPRFVFSRDAYAIETPAKQEVKQAKKVQKEVYRAIHSLAQQASTTGHVDVTATRQTATHVVDSVIRNPDAFMWLTRMKQQDSHSYEQSINTSIWGIVFGRHLGLKKTVLESLATGLLLCKVGKVRNTDDLHSKHSYVEDSLEILKNSPGMNKQILTVVACHQELLNGSGYPRGLSGEDIPILGRIASLVNYYEEITNPNEGDKVGPSEAIARIYSSRNQLFQQDLVEEFIQAIGVYPVGTIVELTSNEVGVVLEHNPDHRLHPKVRLILDDTKSVLRRKVVVDLLEQHNKGEEGPVNIRRTLPFGSIDVDLNKYELSGDRSSWKVLKWIGL